MKRRPKDADIQWTPDTLYVHIAQRFEDQDKAVKAALDSANKLVEQANENTRKWQENANEWRGAMTDRERQFVRKDELKGIWIVLVTSLTAMGAILGIVTFFTKV